MAVHRRKLVPFGILNHAAHQVSAGFDGEVGSDGEAACGQPGQRTVEEVKCDILLLALDVIAGLVKDAVTTVTLSMLRPPALRNRRWLMSTRASTESRLSPAGGWKNCECISIGMVFNSS